MGQERDRESERDERTIAREDPNVAAPAPAEPVAEALAVNESVTESDASVSGASASGGGASGQRHSRIEQEEAAQASASTGDTAPATLSDQTVQPE